jgi:hypothetical protein
VQAAQRGSIRIIRTATTALSFFGYRFTRASPAISSMPDVNQGSERAVLAAEVGSAALTIVPFGEATLPPDSYSSGLPKPIISQRCA